jgi:pimeloyl-ACP methyl ester carboxylesterase
MKNKPTLVFLPGTLCTSAMFQGFINNPRYHCVTIDFIEQSSLAQMCAAIKEKVEDSAVILVGFSMGGMVAFEFIRNFPEQVRGLVLLNSNCHADLPGRKEERDDHLAIAKAKGLASLMKDTYLPIYFYEPNCPESSVVLAMAEQLGTKVFEAQLQVLAERPDSLWTLSSFQQPTIIIGAENDIPCPVQHQQLMNKSAPISELHIIENVGHFAVLEQPTKIRHIINQWVEKHYV